MPGRTGAIFSLPQRPPNAYISLSFCIWFIVAKTIPLYEVNASYIKAIKFVYSAHRGSNTAYKKGMNEYLKVEKEASACEVTERITRITNEHSARKSRQAVAKRAHPSSSTGGLGRKRAQRELEVLLQEAS